MVGECEGLGEEGLDLLFFGESFTAFLSECTIFDKTVGCPLAKVEEPNDMSESTSIDSTGGNDVGGIANTFVGIFFVIA